VIGPRWLGVTTTDGTRRLDQPHDSVRTELEAALAHDVRLIPVLVGGGTMPSAAELPSELQPLAQRQAVTLRDASWRQDVESLVRALRGERQGTRRQWPLVAAALAVVLLVAVVVTVVSRRDDGEPDDDSSITGCPETLEGATDVTLTGRPSATVDSAEGTWEFAVDRAVQREEPSEASAEWDVVLTVTATNETGPPADHDPDFYELAVDGVQFDPWCWSLPFGKNPLESGASNVGLVGFLVPVDPATTALELGIDMGGSPQRIELSPGSVD
jgi:hypothetical protein